MASKINQFINAEIRKTRINARSRNLRKRTVMKRRNQPEPNIAPKGLGPSPKKLQHRIKSGAPQIIFHKLRKRNSWRPGESCRSRRRDHVRTPINWANAGSRIKNKPN